MCKFTQKANIDTPAYLCVAFCIWNVVNINWNKHPHCYWTVIDQILYVKLS